MYQTLTHAYPCYTRLTIPPTHSATMPLMLSSPHICLPPLTVQPAFNQTLSRSPFSWHGRLARVFSFVPIGGNSWAILHFQRPLSGHLTNTKHKANIASAQVSLHLNQGRASADHPADDSAPPIAPIQGKGPPMPPTTISPRASFVSVFVPSCLRGFLSPPLVQNGAEWCIFKKNPHRQSSDSQPASPQSPLPPARRAHP
jgi:hypothetical protein